MEPEEISEFTKELQEGGENNLKTVSLIISVLAVMVAMVTVMGHRTHTEAVLEQSRASDQWNEYQAKKIRQSQFSVAVDMLALQPHPDDATQKKAADYKKHIEKWNEDLTEESDKAHELEDGVHKAEQRASRFDLGEALLQIAVVLSSITLLTRQKLYVMAGVLLGATGLLLAASALLIH